MTLLQLVQLKDDLVDEAALRVELQVQLRPWLAENLVGQLVQCHRMPNCPSPCAATTLRAFVEIVAVGRIFQSGRLHLLAHFKLAVVHPLLEQCRRRRLLGAHPLVKVDPVFLLLLVVLQLVQRLLQRAEIKKKGIKGVNVLNSMLFHNSLMLRLEGTFQLGVTEHRRPAPLDVDEGGRQFQHILIADDRLVVVGQRRVDVAQCVVGVRYVRGDVDGAVQDDGRLLKGPCPVEDGAQRQLRHRPVLKGRHVEGPAGTFNCLLSVARAAPVVRGQCIQQPGGGILKK